MAGLSFGTTVIESYSLTYAYAGVVCWNLLALMAAYSSNIFSHCATRVYLATY